MACEMVTRKDPGVLNLVRGSDGKDNHGQVGLVVNVDRFGGQLVTGREEAKEQKRQNQQAGNP